MKKSILAWLIIFGLIATTGLLAAGQGDGAASSDAKIELEHMTVVSPDGPAGTARRELFEMFTAENPNVTINFNYVAYADFFGQLAVRAMSGKAPALAQAGYHTPEFVEADTLVELGPYIEASGWKEEDFWPGIWDLTMYKGKQWGAPFTLDTRLIFYNKDMFEEADIDIPVTWSEWLAAGEKLQSAIPDVHWYGLVGTESAGQVWTFTPYIFANDTTWIKQGSDGLWQQNLTDPKVIEALEFGNAMVEGDMVPPSWANDNGSMVRALFQQKKIATFLSGPWEIDLYKAAVESGDVDFEMGTFLIPKNVRHASTSGGWSWYAFKTEGVDPQIQWDVIDFLYRNMENKKWYDALPPTKQGMRDIALYSEPIYDDFKKALENSHFPTEVIYGYWELLDILWQPNIEVLSGAKDAADAMHDTAAAVQALLDEKQNALILGEK